ncbi:diguanylate cyclase [Bacillus sp. T3]|uniref:diguanylate cyclase n=1 Tax=Bacillus sp. T3 TaxID=467262 RepID=UPI002980C782|nr:diguanylate cyclase [Bacillus sp. T3]
MDIRLDITRTYTVLVSLIGILAFLLMEPFHFLNAFNSFLTYAILGAILLLSHFTITIAPYEKTISMDSAIYLSTLFLNGPMFTLHILLFHYIIYGIWKRETEWWKHVFNFATYTLMLIVAYFIFILFGGDIGGITSSNLMPYVLSLSSYFFTNMFLSSIYLFLSKEEDKLSIKNEFFKNKSFLISYSFTLLLSIVLGILIEHEGVFGLFLFICISLLVSFAFSHSFQLFQSATSKARIDFLTGLNNHGSFKEILEKEIELAKQMNQPLSLALLDLDDFKKYNDLYGHIQGDVLLKTFGTLIESYASSKQFITARYGGEEFVILMPNTKSQGAFFYVNQVRRSVNNTYIEGVEALPYGCLSFSAGIAELEQGTYNSSELLHKADQAMYRSKAQGKNMVQIFQEKLARTQFVIDEELEKAEQQLSLFLSKDVHTYRHSKRVCQYAFDFAQMLKLAEHERNILVLGALVHDIGKLEVPKYLLLKKGKLESSEWDIVKDHVVFGKDIISTNKSWAEVLPLVELHHERFDGLGYPYGLKGENIPKLARILCILDSFDAMTSERPYQRIKTFEEAIDELQRCTGKQFDPKFVKPFIQMIKTL